jgi:glycine/serine hydroxymethyltransferase
MREAEMAEIAAHIASVLRAPDDATVAESVKQEVTALCTRFSIHDV